MKRTKLVTSLLLCSAMALGGCGTTPAASSSEPSKENSAAQESTASVEKSTEQSTQQAEEPKALSSGRGMAADH